MPMYQLKSKIGRPYWAAGKQIGPDKWVDVELDVKQLREIAEQCIPPCSEGGVFDIKPDPFVAAREAYNEAREATVNAVGQKRDGLPPATAMRIAKQAFLAGLPNAAAPTAVNADAGKPGKR